MSGGIGLDRTDAGNGAIYDVRGDFNDGSGQEFPYVLWTQICIALELVPGVVKRELGDFVDLVTPLKQAARRLVAQVMETQILNTEEMTGSCEGSASALWVVREDELHVLGLALDDLPSFGCVLEAFMVTFPFAGMFCVAHEPRAGTDIIVGPL